jgi:hypothetical protein
MMQEQARLGRNQQRMTELYPWFARQVSKVIADLEAQGLRPRIQDAWRSPEDQLTAYNSGHSKLKYGFHNVTGSQGEKQSLAVDLLDDNAPLKPSSSYVLKLTAAAEKHGLTTGARWGLPVKLAKAIDDAIATQNWKAPVKLGWDPLHVEPANFTPSQAYAGNRPDDV